MQNILRHFKWKVMHACFMFNYFYKCSFLLGNARHRPQWLSNIAYTIWYVLICLGEVPPLQRLQVPEKVSEIKGVDFKVTLIFFICTHTAIIFENAVLPRLRFCRVHLFHFHQLRLCPIKATSWRACGLITFLMSTPGPIDLHRSVGLYLPEDTPGARVIWFSTLMAPSIPAVYWVDDSKAVRFGGWEWGSDLRS